MLEDYARWLSVSKADLPFGVPQGPVVGSCFLPSMSASCMCPLHQATLLQHWTVYNHACPLSSHGCWRLKWRWTQIKPNSSSLSEKNNSGATFFMFPIDLFGVKSKPAKSTRNLGVIFWQYCHLPLTYIWGLQLMFLPHPGLAVYLLVSRSRYCKIACKWKSKCKG